MTTFDFGYVDEDVVVDDCDDGKGHGDVGVLWLWPVGVAQINELLCWQNAMLILHPDRRPGVNADELAWLRKYHCIFQNAKDI